MPTMNLDGVDVFYEDLGEGEPLLLIHGAAASGRWFGDLPSRIATSRRVVVPDLRGLGQSQRIEDLVPPRIWVDDMWACLDAAGIDSADVAGVSLGSRIAGRMALETPHRVRSLIVDAPILGISTHGNASLNTAFTSVDEGSEQAQEWLELHGSDWRKAVAFYATARTAPGFQEYYTLRTDIGDVKVPTLICRGDLDDEIHPVDDAFIWHKAAPRSELFIAPGCTQSSVMLERPTDFVAALEGFLGRNAMRQLA